MPRYVVAAMLADDMSVASLEEGWEIKDDVFPHGARLPVCHH